ncbi:hypothetical protein [Paenibacillus odorifer]|uniref:hypothetical protein n=1 Tax=Paenibacillus odorifer TaxID=189426 RepID=UPI00096FF068|nr:hypothetical protein [Paenibacillus odorifer]OMD93551.1 hypothetical protein BSK67_16665 [Paenibacillus odorifer]
MATYKQIQEYVKHECGYIPKSCWIAHMKELSGLHPKMSSRRYSPNARVHPCPIEKQDDIKESFQYFKMI